MNELFTLLRFKLNQLKSIVDYHIALATYN